MPSLSGTGRCEQPDTPSNAAVTVPGASQGSCVHKSDSVGDLSQEAKMSAWLVSPLQRCCPEYPLTTLPSSPTAGAGSWRPPVGVREACVTSSQGEQLWSQAASRCGHRLPNADRSPSARGREPKPSEPPLVPGVPCGPFTHSWVSISLYGTRLPYDTARGSRRHVCHVL